MITEDRLKQLQLDITEDGHLDKPAAQELLDEVRRMYAILDANEYLDVWRALDTEVKFQRAKWNAAHDARKSDLDWHWLIGWLSSKAVLNPDEKPGSVAKRCHRIITIAAAAINWHAHVLGRTDMGPGVPPDYKPEGQE